MLYRAVEKLEHVSAVFIDLKFTLIYLRTYGTFIANLFLGQAEMETVVNGCFILSFLQNITFKCFVVKLLLSYAFRLLDAESANSSQMLQGSLLVTLEVGISVIRFQALKVITFF